MGPMNFNPMQGLRPGMPQGAMGPQGGVPSQAFNGGSFPGQANGGVFPGQGGMAGGFPGQANGGMFPGQGAPVAGQFPGTGGMQPQGQMQTMGQGMQAQPGMGGWGTGAFSPLQGQGAPNGQASRNPYLGRGLLG
jgi:hypothetical protein